MVKRMFEMMYKEVRGLHQAAYVLGSFAFLSQVLALIRDRLLAHQFGAGIELDVYYAAFRIPDLLYVLFASTLSVYVLIPFIANRLHTKNGNEARELLAQVFSSFLVVYTLCAVVIFVCAPYLTTLLFPGLQAHNDDLVVLLRILLLQPCLLGISSLFGVVTQLSHRFVLYAVSPLLYNLGIIFGIAFLYPLLGLQGLAFGVVLGALMHLLVQMPFLRSSSLRFGITTRISYTLMLSILKVSIPRALTLAQGQIAVIVLIGFASTLTTGSVSVFQFAFNLQSVPLAIIGASYSIAAFPYLADLFAQKRIEAFAFHVTSALRHIIFWSVPVIGLIIVLRAHLVRVVLGSGAFSWADTRLTAALLALFALSLVAQAISLLIVRAFYAGGYTRTPFFVTLIGSVFSVVLPLWLYQLYSSHGAFKSIFLHLLRIEDVAGAEVVVIGLGYSVAVCLQAIVLLLQATKKFNIPMQWFAISFARSLTAAMFGGLVAYGTLNLFVEGINETRFLGILLQGVLGGIAGIVGVICTYYILRSPELREIYKSMHRKMFKKDIVAPQEDIL